MGFRSGLILAAVNVVASDGGLLPGGEQPGYPGGCSCNSGLKLLLGARMRR